MSLVGLVKVLKTKRQEPVVEPSPASTSRSLAGCLCFKALAVALSLFLSLSTRPLLPPSILVPIPQIVQCPRSVLQTSPAPLGRLSAPAYSLKDHFFPPCSRCPPLVTAHGLLCHSPSTFDKISSSPFILHLPFGVSALSLKCSTRPYRTCSEAIFHPCHKFCSGYCYLTHAILLRPCR